MSEKEIWRVRDREQVVLLQKQAELEQELEQERKQAQKRKEQENRARESQRYLFTAIFSAFVTAQDEYRTT